MRRFFVGDGAVRDGRIYVEDAGDVRHIRTVLRMKRGDGLVVCDASGREYRGVIEELGETVTLSVTGSARAAAEPRTKVTLYQCAPKRGKMEVIIQKSTELGAVRFVPVFSERSVLKPDSREDAERRAERWQRVAEEAAKQSGRALVPVVDAPLSVAEAVETFGEFDLTLFPYEKEDRTTIKDALRDFAARLGPGASGDAPGRGDDPVAGGGTDDAPAGRAASGDTSRVALFVGPEGGFTDAEAFAIEDAGAIPCSLGGTILRTETAGPAAIAMVMYEREL